MTELEKQMIEGIELQLAMYEAEMDDAQADGDTEVFKKLRNEFRTIERAYRLIKTNVGA